MAPKDEVYYISTEHEGKKTSRKYHATADFPVVTEMQGCFAFKPRLGKKRGHMLRRKGDKDE
jgi:hypothetical protein